MEKSLSKVKDVDLEILSKLGDRDLLNFCSSHKYGKSLCDNDNFWRNRLEKFFPGASSFKSPTRSWKNYYLKIIYYLDKAKKELNLSNDRLIILYDEKIKDHALFFASIKGDRDLIDFFIFSGAMDFSLALAGAARGGHRDLFDFFLNKIPEEKKLYNLYTARTNAILRNQMDLLLYLEKLVPYENNQAALYDELEIALYDAARSGSLDMVKHIIDLGAKNWEAGKEGAKEHPHLVEFFDDLIKNKK